MSDFTYTPSYQSRVEEEHRTVAAQFGGGYMQEAPDGINPVREVWSVGFDNIPRATGDDIRAFFRARVGQPFTWTPPGGSEGKYKLRGNVSMVFTGGTTVSLAFVLAQHFGP
jgi:phage-related protein